MGPPAHPAITYTQTVGDLLVQLGRVTAYKPGLIHQVRGSFGRVTEEDWKFMKGEHRDDGSDQTDHLLTLLRTAIRVREQGALNALWKGLDDFRTFLRKYPLYIKVKRLAVLLPDKVHAQGDHLPNFVACLRRTLFDIPPDAMELLASFSSSNSRPEEETTIGKETTRDLRQLGHALNEIPPAEDKIEDLVTNLDETLSIYLRTLWEAAWNKHAKEVGLSAENIYDGRRSSSSMSVEESLPHRRNRFSPIGRAQLRSI
ncbi:hypothetical protein JCM10212_002013 [Sporobolomyces blumeae]